MKVEVDGKSTRKIVKQMEQKLTKVEQCNKSLEMENLHLKEKLLGLEYRQQRNNLIFEGVVDSAREADLECIRKLRFVLKDVPGLNVAQFRIDRCHRLDGHFKPQVNHRLICAFNWYNNVQCILRNRKCLPKGVYVSEDLPEEWIDRCKILKPIFNAAKRNENLKDKTHLTKDRLIIDGNTYAAGPEFNYANANAVIDLKQTCERSSDDKSVQLFLGCHSPFSNLYTSSFNIDNVVYSCVEQYLQSQKAATFNDDTTHAKIMKEKNPYKMKKYGNRVKGFNEDRWKQVNKDCIHKAVHAKFTQNNVLLALLKDSGNTQICESSHDDCWGTAVHLHDWNALDRRHWKNPTSGLMSEILSRVRQEIRK